MSSENVKSPPFEDSEEPASVSPGPPSMALFLVVGAMVAAVAMVLAKRHLQNPIPFRIGFGMLGITFIVLVIRLYRADFKRWYQGWFIMMWLALWGVALFIGLFEAVLDIFNINL